MTKRLFAALAALSALVPNAHAGEAKPMDKLAPFFWMHEVISGYPDETATAEEAVKLGSYFCGETRPQDQKRLKDIWELGDKDKRVQALHEWAKEIIDGKTDADDSTVINIMTTLICWTSEPRKDAIKKWDQHECHIEHDLGFAHLMHRCAAAEHLNGDSLRYYLDQLRPYMCYWRSADIWLRMVTEVYADRALVAAEEYPKMHNKLTMPGVSTKQWRANVAAEKAYLENSPLTGGKAWHSWDKIFVPVMDNQDNWTAETLPRMVTSTFEMLQNSRKGVPADTAKLDALKDAPELATRCKLTADPDAKAWKALDSGAPLYDMPDASAVQLPQFDAALLGKGSLQGDLKELAALLKKAADKKDALDGIKLLILRAGDKIFPDDYGRVHMNTRGYDSFSSHIEFEFTESGSDIVIVNDVPNIDPDDPVLQQQARQVEQLLHRIIVRLAWAEQKRGGWQPKPGESPGEGYAKLADLLNKYHLWPLMLNEYELRGMSLPTYVGLVERFNDDKELLYAFTELPDASMSYAIAKELGKGKVDTKVVTRCLRAMLAVAAPGKNIAVMGPGWSGLAPKAAKEREADARAFVELATEAGGTYRAGAIQYLCYNGMEALAEELLGKNPEAEIQGSSSFTGYCMVKRALERKDLPRARKLLETMLKHPLSKSHAAGRMAMALVARAEGKDKEAGLLQKDAVILAGLRMQRGGYNSHPAILTLCREGLFGDLERMWELLPNLRGDKDLRIAIIDACARAGSFEQAAYMADKMLAQACRISIPDLYTPTQAELSLLRRRADFYYALDLLVKGDALGEKLLPKAKAALAPYIGAVVPDPLEGLVKLARDKAAAVAAKRGIPAGATFPAEPLLQRKGVSIISAEQAAPVLQSKVYTWHLSNGKTEKVIDASIEAVAYFHNNPDICWIRLKTEDGQVLRININRLSEEDIDHLAEWQEQNGFIPCEPTPENTSPYAFKPFVGVVTGMGSQKMYPGGKAMRNGVELKGDGRYVNFRLPDGNVKQVYFAEMSPETRALVEPLFEAETKSLKVLKTWDEAKAYAKAHDRKPAALFVGKPGGLHDKMLQENVLDKPEVVADYNAQYALVLCFQNEQGQWDTEGRKILLEMDSEIPGILASAGDGGMLIEQAHRGHDSILRMKAALWPEKLPADWAALEQAIRNQNTDAIAKLLKENPALLQARFSGGVSTPLFAARMGFKEKSFQALLDAGADPNERSKSGEPILANVVGPTKLSPFYTRALLEAGANPNVMVPPGGGRFDNSPLVMGALFNKTTLMLMLEHGLDPDPETDDLPLCVLLSTRLKEDELMEVLPQMVARGLDLPRHGAALWRNCARKNYPRVLEYLKTQGVKPL